MATLTERRYGVASFDRGEAVLQELTVGFEVESRPVDVESTIYDTFDWRLHRRGMWLAETGDPRRRRGRRLELRTLAGESLYQVPISRPLQSRGGLPPGPLGERVGKVIDCRALLPVAVMRRRGVRRELRDSRGKVVARVAVEIVSTKVPGGRPKRLGHQLRLSPVRGYARVERELRRRLESAEQAREIESSELDVILESVGRRPRDYSGRLRVELAPEKRADRATRRLLLALLSVIQKNEPGALEDLDPEFLHDYRVAVRRSRSLLARLRGVFPERDRRRLLDGLRRLQKATNRMRDLDVFVLEMPRYREQLEPEFADALSPLEELLAEEKAKEHRRMAGAISSARSRRFLAAYQRYLERDPPARTSLADAMRPVRDVASERIWKIYRRILDRGSKLDATSAAAKIHRLRIDGKKLRYLLEAFRSLYPERVEREIRVLKKLQDVLGRFNDYEVHREALADFGDRLAHRSRPQTQQALGQLIERFASGQESCRREIEDRFARFAKKKHQKAYAELFGPRREPS